ncbi:MAG: GyrI-like domain-containing protein [Sphingomonadales bacterium]
MLNPIIIESASVLLTGISSEMSLSTSQNQIPELWGKLRRQQKQRFTVDPDYFYSVNVYPANYFENFNPSTTFVKHALVSSEYAIKSDLSWNTFEMPGGLYAVFTHRGPDISIFQYIYTQWLPGSGYILDDRPHFEKMPASYIPGHPESEEEIYIPIRPV